MPDTEAFWRLPEVIERTGMTSSTIYRHAEAGTFPSPRRLAGRTVAWWAPDVLDWMRSRPTVALRPGHKSGHAGNGADKKSANTRF